MNAGAPNPPPRLAVLGATHAPLAVVLRRGPSERVMTLLWNRDSGAITPGQWLAGTIYEHRSDLSPDGQWLVIFAGKGGRWWTAVSRAPWLRAHWLCHQSSTWHGGGAFCPDGRLWLNGGAPGPADLDDGSIRVTPDTRAFSHATDGFHMGALFAQRMMARGWHASGTGYNVILTKPLGAQARLVWTIALGAKDRALISNHVALDGAAPPANAPDRWEWADIHAGRLQFAARGCLWQAGFDRAGRIAPARLLHDFAPHVYTPEPAPKDC